MTKIQVPTSTTIFKQQTKYILVDWQIFGNFEFVDFLCQMTLLNSSKRIWKSIREKYQFLQTKKELMQSFLKFPKSYIQNTPVLTFTIPIQYSINYLTKRLCHYNFLHFQVCQFMCYCCLKFKYPQNISWMKYQNYLIIWDKNIHKTYKFVLFCTSIAIVKAVVN